MCFTESVFSRLGDVDVWPSMPKCTWRHLHLCAFVFFALYKFFRSRSSEEEDNGAGPRWTDDECVHLMTTKA